MDNEMKCGECGATGVRIYREAGVFYRPADNRCNAHVTKDQRGWYVPLRMATEGHPWGHTSGPPESVTAFYARPEADPNGWSYQPKIGWGEVMNVQHSN